MRASLSLCVCVCVCVCVFDKHIACDACVYTVHCTLYDSFEMTRLANTNDMIPYILYNLQEIIGQLIAKQSLIAKQ